MYGNFKRNMMITQPLDLGVPNFDTFSICSPYQWMKCAILAELPRKVNGATYWYCWNCWRPGPFKKKTRTLSQTLSLSPWKDHSYGGFGSQHFPLIPWPVPPWPVPPWSGQACCPTRHRAVVTLMGSFHLGDHFFSSPESSGGQAGFTLVRIIQKSGIFDV